MGRRLENVEADAWIQVVPLIGTSYYNRGEISGAKAARMGITKPKPENRIPGSVLLRVKLRLPTQVFDPIVETTIAVDDAQTEVTVEQGEVAED